MDSQSKYDKYNRNQEAKAFYKGKEWNQCRVMALKRDHYLCQRCLENGKIKGYDVVHHIKPLEEHPRLAYTLSNLVCLCHKCHNDIHKTGEQKPKYKSNKVKIVKSKKNKEMF